MTKTDAFGNIQLSHGAIMRKSVWQNLFPNFYIKEVVKCLALSLELMKIHTTSN